MEVIGVWSKERREVTMVEKIQPELVWRHSFLLAGRMQKF